MDLHICKKCKKRFARANILKDHMNGTACKKSNYYCKLCSKGFTTETSMYRHMRQSCKTKQKEDALKNEIYSTLMKDAKAELEAEMKESLKAEIEYMKEIMKKESKDKEENHEKQIKELSLKIKKLESKDSTGNITAKNSNINTGTINNTTNNIIIVGHGKEDMTKIDSADILKVLKNGYNSTIHLTEAVHFNPKYPEFQNVYISNMKDKYAMMYNGKKWMLVTKEVLIDKIYNNKRNYIEENLDKFVESLSKPSVNALKRWLDTDEDNPRITQIKNDIKLLLYNSRDMPLNSIQDIPEIKDNQSDTELAVKKANISKTKKSIVKKSEPMPKNKQIIIADEESNEETNVLSDETTDNSVVFSRTEKYIKK
jgi:hypothetical protein